MPDPDPVPLHRLCVPEPDTVPFAVGTFDAIGPLSRADYPHRHTFYEIVLVTGGDGAHVIDFAAHPLRPPHIGFITPGQVHHWQATGLDGRVLLFTEGFLLDHPADRDAWQAIAERPWLALSTAEAGEFADLLRLMEDEHRRREADFLTVLQAYLHVLLIRARRVPGHDCVFARADRATAVAQEFSRLVAREHRADPSVRTCAARLGVSVGYLSEVVKVVTGRTPGQLIREARVIEARRLLGGTDLTVAQVSRELGFADPAYFCRFFRRETGTSPGDFRRASRNHHVPRIVSIDPPPPRQ